MLMIVNKGSSLTILNEGSSLTIVKKGSSIMIVNETTKLYQNGYFWKKLHETLLNVVLHEV